jgi:DNA replication protein DnaC
MMSEDVKMPRRIPDGLLRTDALDEQSFGYDMIEPAAKAMVTTGNGTPNLTGFGFALFAPAGSGKSAVAAAVVNCVRGLAPWLTSFQSPWVPAAWIADYATPYMHDDATGEPVVRCLTHARLLIIDGLGEESEKTRNRVVAIIKDRIDAGRPLVITSRLQIDGANSLAAHYPHVRSALRRRFVMKTPYTLTRPL